MSATPYQSLIVNSAPLRTVKVDTEHQHDQLVELNYVLPDGYLVVVNFTDSDDDVVSHILLTDGATKFNSLPKLVDGSALAALEARIEALEA